MVVGRAEMRVEHPRTLQEEMHVDFPREPHAAVYLRRRLPVHDRRFAAEKLRTGDGTIERGKVRAGSEVRVPGKDGGARDLRAYPHVGTNMLDRLEPRDPSVELAAFLG